MANLAVGRRETHLWVASRELGRGARSDGGARSGRGTLSSRITMILNLGSPILRSVARAGAVLLHFAGRVLSPCRELIRPGCIVLGPREDANPRVASGQLGSLVVNGPGLDGDGRRVASGQLGSLVVPERAGNAGGGKEAQDDGDGDGRAHVDGSSCVDIECCDVVCDSNLDLGARMGLFI